MNEIYVIVGGEPMNEIYVIVGLGLFCLLLYHSKRYWDFKEKVGRLFKS